MPDEQFDTFRRPERWEPAWSEAVEPPGVEHQQQQQHEHPQPATPVEDEVLPDRASDSRYIEVRTPEYEAGTGAAKGFNIATGRILITYRLRNLPDEAGLDHVTGEPFFPVPLLEATPRESQKLAKGEQSDWKPGVPEELLTRFLGPEDPEGPGQNDAMSFGRWRSTFGR